MGNQKELPSVDPSMSNKGFIGDLLFIIIPNPPGVSSAKLTLMMASFQLTAKLLLEMGISIKSDAYYLVFLS